MSQIMTYKMIDALTDITAATPGAVRRDALIAGALILAAWSFAATKRRTLSSARVIPRQSSSSVTHVSLRA
jgi:hypothetical protein